MVLCRCRPYDSTFCKCSRSLCVFCRSSKTGCTDEKLREIAYPEIMAPKDKSYYVLTETDGAPAAEEFGRSVPVLPQALAPYAHVSLDISDDLAKYAAVGQLHSVVLRFRVSGATELDRLRFTLNGKDLPQEPACLRRINELYRMTAPRYREPPRYCYSSIWVTFFQGCQQYRCGQASTTVTGMSSSWCTSRSTGHAPAPTRSA